VGWTQKEIRKQRGNLIAKGQVLSSGLYLIAGAWDRTVSWSLSRVITVCHLLSYPRGRWMELRIRLSMIAILRMLLTLIASPYILYSVSARTRDASTLVYWHGVKSLVNNLRTRDGVWAGVCSHVLRVVRGSRIPARTSSANKASITRIYTLPVGLKAFIGWI